MEQNWQNLLIEEDGRSTGRCECCQNETISLSGFVSTETESLAAYFIAYTNGQPKHGAEFTFVVGKWGDAAMAKDRFVIVMHHFPEQGFMIDSDIVEKKSNMQELASNFLNRDDIIGSKFADTLFSMVDAVYMKDSRLDEIRNWKADA